MGARRGNFLRVWQLHAEHASQRRRSGRIRYGFFLLGEFRQDGRPERAGYAQLAAFNNSKAEVMNLNDPSKAIPFPNVEKLKALDGYYAWRRSQEAEKLSNNSPKGAN